MPKKQKSKYKPPKIHPMCEFDRKLLAVKRFEEARKKVISDEDDFIPS